MNDDLYLDPANTSIEPETLKALVTAAESNYQSATSSSETGRTVPRPSRERYSGLGFFAKHDSGDVGTEARRALDELDSNQAEIARLTGKLEWMRRENGELYDDAAANATRADKAQAESDRLRAEVDRLTADVAARDETIAALVLWTPFRDDEAEDLTDAVGAPVEGEPQHD